MKFRIWNSDEDCLEMITPIDDKFQDQYLLTMKGQLYEWDMDNCEFIEPEYNTDYKIMFSTGLFDKNNKEIYEGDVLICKSYLDPYTDAILYMEVKTYTDFLTKCGPRPLFDSDIIKILSSSYEVLGNKYENPDLLDLLEGDEDEI